MIILSSFKKKNKKIVVRPTTFFSQDRKRTNMQISMNYVKPTEIEMVTT